MNTENKTKPKQWSALENAAIVSAYLRMVEKQNAGTPYMKSKFRAELIGTPASPGPCYTRSDGSIEFKFMNVSACMRAIGRIEVTGYKPAMNYQSDLMREVCKQTGHNANASA